MPIERMWLQVHDAEVRAKAIDEFEKKCLEEIFKRGHYLDGLDITVIADQLKAGDKHD